MFSLSEFYSYIGNSDSFILNIKETIPDNFVSVELKNLSKHQKIQLLTKIHIIYNKQNWHMYIQTGVIIF